jgi:hypothetical protein
MKMKCWIMGMEICTQENSMSLGLVSPKEYRKFEKLYGMLVGADLSKEYDIEVTLHKKKKKKKGLKR